MPTEESALSDRLRLPFRDRAVSLRPECPERRHERHGECSAPANMREHQPSIRQTAAEMAKEMESCLIGPQTLRVCFPELYRKLRRAVVAVRAGRVYFEMAARHALCAEALVEVLNARARNHRGSKEAYPGEIADEYGKVAAGKVIRFANRRAEERKRIAKAYPHVDLTHIRLGYKHGLIGLQGIANALESPTEISRLLERLNELGLLGR